MRYDRYFPFAVGVGRHRLGNRHPVIHCITGGAAMKALAVVCSALALIYALSRLSGDAVALLAGAALTLAGMIALGLWAIVWRSDREEHERLTMEHRQQPQYLAPMPDPQRPIVIVMNQPTTGTPTARTVDADDWLWSEPPSRFVVRWGDDTTGGQP